MFVSSIKECVNLNKLIIAISGASGASLGLKVKQHLPKHITPYFILTDHAREVLKKEENLSLLEHFEDSNIAAPMASGSFQADAMMITPCSMNTLAKIASGIADNLTTRTASVMIKEQKKLLLAPREMPFSPIALENMLKLSRLNTIIAPPILGYYAKTDTLEKMEDFIIGKWFDLLGIKNNLYERWNG
jgi:flavin prenyltransferase